MRTVTGVILGIFLGGAMCGFGSCFGVEWMLRQPTGQQGNMEVFVLDLLALFGGGVIGAALGGIIGGVIGARKDQQAEFAPDSKHRFHDND
jgi:hypothetical protein